MTPSAIPPRPIAAPSSTRPPDGEGRTARSQSPSTRARVRPGSVQGRNPGARSRSRGRTARPPASPSSATYRSTATPPPRLLWPDRHARATPPRTAPPSPACGGTRKISPATCTRRGPCSRWWCGVFISAAVPSAAGLLIGLFWQPVGIAAPVVFGLLLIGAVRFHAKAGDYANPKTGATRWHPPLTAVAVAAAITLASLLGGGCESHSPACCRNSPGPRRRRSSTDGRGTRPTHPLTSAWAIAATASRGVTSWDVVCVEVLRSDLRPGINSYVFSRNPSGTLRPTYAVRRTAQRPSHRAGPRAGGAASADVPQSDGSAPTVKESARRPRSDSVVRYVRP